MPVTGNNTMLIGLAVFLMLAVIEDLARRRISNVLTFSAALLGLGLQFIANGPDGVLNGVGGFAVGLGIFLPFFLLGGMGAGDVKAMAAAGAFLTPWSSLLAAGLSLVAGSVFGLALLTWRGGLADMFRVWSLRLIIADRTARPDMPPAARMRFPYALAIAAGTLGAVAWLGSR
jgi:prepilin peptidase CpaA